jgi:hypothetical protein
MDKKIVLKYCKSMMKILRGEIKRLNNEIKDCIKAFDGFEKFIIESIFFINDRSNLVSSHIRLHLNKINTLRLLIKRSPVSDTTDIELEQLLETYSGQFISSLNTIDTSINEDIVTVSDCIPDYMQNINKKIITLMKYRTELQFFYKKIKDKYSLIKCRVFKKRVNK